MSEFTLESPRKQVCFVIDLETTGREPTEAHVIEWAYCITDENTNWTAKEGMVKPPVLIPPETSAIHHIIDADVAEAPDWGAESYRLSDVIRELNPVALVAHNTDMERHFIEPLAQGVPWICTYRAALRAWPEAPSHSNEGLRYYLGLPRLGRRYFQQAHSAAHDTMVTAQILRRLLLHVRVEDMIIWTDEPAKLPRCPIGDYRGLPWNEVPSDFLSWTLSKPDMRKDVVFCARAELKRRYEQESEGAV